MKNKKSKSSGGSWILQWCEVQKQFHIEQGPTQWTGRMSRFAHGESEAEPWATFGLWETDTAHMTKNNSDKAVLKELHGAIAELGKPSGFLSVTSMNQLVHNPKFSIDETHISTLFNNVFPLLEAMNR